MNINPKYHGMGFHIDATILQLAIVNNNPLDIAMELFDKYHVFFYFKWWYRI
ncbi:MAG: hypothetical protein PHY59_04115 [Methanobacterium sp.]|nr:hypothetical protein [Methanobacterium sp.]